MADNESRTRIILEADKGSADATRRALKDVQTEMSSLEKRTETLSSHFDSLAESIADAKVRKFEAAAAAQDLARGELKAAQASTRVEEQALKEAAALEKVANAERDVNAARGDGADGRTGGAVAPGGGGGDGRNFLTKFGSTLRNLPSQQIPGLGIGTDAIGNFARLGGAALDAAKAAGVLSTAQKIMTTVQGGLAAATTLVTGVITGATSVTSALATAGTALAGGLTAVGAAMAGAIPAAIGFVAALGPVAIIGAIVAVALGGIALAAARLASDAQKANEDLADAYAARRAIQDFVRSGATSEDAKKRLAETQQLLEDEQGNLAEAKASYAEAFNAAANSVPILGDLFARIADVFGAFSATKNEIAEAEKATRKASQEQRFLTGALEKGAFAAADRKEAEEEAAKEQERLDDERKREAEQHAKDLESAYKRIDDSNRQFAQKQEDNARAYQQKLADIETGRVDKGLDIQQKYTDDLVKLGVKARRDEVDARTKALRTEQDARAKDQAAALEAALKQQRALQDIRTDALRDEQDQLRDRNFLEAANAGENAQRAIDDANLDAKREAQDRAAAREQAAKERAVDVAREREDRLLEQARAREDRKTALATETRDAKTAYERQLRDADIARKRQEETTLIAYQREQAQLQDHLNQLLGITAEGQAQERALRAGASAETALRSGTNSTTTYGGATNINDYRAMTFTANGGISAQTVDLFRRISLETMQATRYR